MDEPVEKKKVRRRVVKKRKRKKIRRLRPVRAVLLLILTILSGIVLGQGISCMTGLRGADGKQGFFHAPRWMARLLAPVMTVPGVQSDGSFLLAGFESISEFRVWESLAATMEPDQEHAVEGKYSAKLTFMDHTKMASVAMQDYFESRFPFQGWLDYDRLKFTIYNPEEKAGRVIFKMKDEQGREFKQDLQIPGMTERQFSLPLADIAKHVNLKKVVQLNFFLWDVHEERVYYLDDLRLTPFKKAGAGDEEAAA